MLLFYHEICLCVGGWGEEVLVWVLRWLCVRREEGLFVCVCSWSTVFQSMHPTLIVLHAVSVCEGVCWCIFVDVVWVCVYVSDITDNLNVLSFKLSRSCAWYAWINNIMGYYHKTMKESFKDFVYFFPWFNLNTSVQECNNN